MKKFTPTLATFCCSAALIAGCEKSAPPASTSPAAASSSADPGNAPQPASPPAPPAPSAEPASTGRQSAGGISWENPQGWKRGAESDMRLATLTDGTADVAISSFGGNVGGVLANVNRWRQQVGLPPVTSQADAEKQMTEIDVNGRKIHVFDFEGPAKRTLVASVPGDDKLYFIKLTAPVNVVAARRDAFDRIVKSVRVE